MRALIITTDRDEPLREENIDEDLGSLQEAVGSDIQIIGIKGTDALMILAEDGKLRGFEANFRATFLAHATRSTFSHDVIAGKVLIAGGYTDEGDLGDLDDGTIALVQSMVSVSDGFELKA